MKFRGLSPKLPLARDYEDGYSLNKTYREMVKQNVKMLLLTAPGERIMEPDFGVGLRNFLFENNTASTKGSIRAKITKQIGIYMPFIKVVEINLHDSETNERLHPNYLKIEFKYFIEPLNQLDVVDLDFDFSKELLT